MRFPITAAYTAFILAVITIITFIHDVLPITESINVYLTSMQQNINYVAFASVLLYIPILCVDYGWHLEIMSYLTDLIKSPVAYHMSRPSESDLQQIVAMGRKEIGPLHDDVDRIGIFLRRSPDIVKCLYDSYFPERIIAYFIVYPLNDSICEGLLRGTVTRADDIKPDNLTRTLSGASGVYIAMVCATSMRSKAAVMAELIHCLRFLFKDSRLKFVFTRAATPLGRRMMGRFRFKPISEPDKICLLALYDGALDAKTVANYERYRIKL